MAALLPTTATLMTPAETPAVVPFVRLGDVVRIGGAHEVALAFAEIDEAFSVRLAVVPDDYVALVGRGELWLRTGRAGDAKPLLERAAFQRPPSWEAYQYVNALLRRAEVLAAREFSRGSGAGLPGGELLLALGRRLVSACRGARRGNG